MTQAQLKKAYGTELSAINGMLKAYYDIDNITIKTSGSDTRYKINNSGYEYIYQTLSKRIKDISNNAEWNGHTDTQIYNVLKQYPYCLHINLYL